MIELQEMIDKLQQLYPPNKLVNPMAILGVIEDGEFIDQKKIKKPKTHGLTREELDAFGFQDVPCFLDHPETGDHRVDKQMDIEEQINRD